MAYFSHVQGKRGKNYGGNQKTIHGTAQPRGAPPGSRDRWANAWRAGAKGPSPPDPKLEGHKGPVAHVNAVEVRAAGDVLAFEEVVVEDVATRKIQGGARAEDHLHASRQALIDVVKAIVAANALGE